MHTELQRYILDENNKLRVEHRGWVWNCVTFKAKQGENKKSRKNAGLEFGDGGTTSPSGFSLLINKTRLHHLFVSLKRAKTKVPLSTINVIQAYFFYYLQ